MGIRGVFNKTIETLGFNLFVTIFSLLISVFTARTLGPEIKGTYSLLIFIPAIFFTISHFGVNLATTFFVANGRHDRSKVINTSLLLSLALGILFGLAGYVIHLFLKEAFLPEVPEILFIIVFLTIPIQLVYSSLDNALVGMNQIRSFNIFYLLKPFLNFILIVLFYFLFKDHLGWFIFSSLLSQLLPLPFLLSKISTFSSLSLRFYDNFIARKLFHFGLKNYLSSLVLYLEFKIDIFIIYYFIDSINVGFYSIAVAAAEISSSLVAAVNTVLFPLIADKRNETEKYKRAGFFLSLILSITFSGLLFLLAPVLVNWIFGEIFQPSVLPLQILSVAIIFSNLKRNLMNSFSAEEKAHINNWVNLPSLFINVGANFLLVPTMGIAGAACASLISYVLSSLAMIIISIRQGIKLRSER